jgi:thiol:disulfide interchange protein
MPSTQSRSLLGALKRYESFLWIGVLAAVLWLRWPLIKGFYYKTVQVEAPASTVPWRPSYQAALAEARETGRPVLVSFGATWCPWCRFMKHDVWPKPAVQRAVSTAFVPLEIDIDQDPITASRYGIEAVPTLLVVDPSGTELRRSGFLDADDLVDFLDTH